MTARPHYSHDGKLLACGELPRGKRGSDEAVNGARPRFRAGEPDPTRAKRPCSCCGLRFQPTRTRRLLCARCFKTGGTNAPGVGDVQRAIYGRGG